MKSPLRFATVPVLLGAVALASLSLNVAFLSRHAAAPGDGRTTGAGHHPGATIATSVGTADNHTDGSPDPGASPHAGMAVEGTTAAPAGAANLAALRDKLLASGVSGEDARLMLAALVRSQRDARIAAIRQKYRPNLEYWQGLSRLDPRRGPSADEIAAIRAVEADSRAQMESLFPGSTVPTRADLAFLPEDKRATIAAIERDYADMMRGIKSDSALFRTQDDTDQLRYLEGERGRELASALSPSELREYEMRQSPLANQLRNQFGSLVTDEQEFRQLFDMQRDYAMRFDPERLGLPADMATGGDTSNDSKASARQDLLDAERNLLGDDRWQQYQLAQDVDYREIAQAQARFGLTDDTVRQVYDMKFSTATLAQTIAQDPTLTRKEKKERLTILATQVRNDVRTTLGDNVGDAYLGQAMGWLTTLDQGRSIVIKANGKVGSVGLPKDPAPVTTVPKG